MPSPQRTYSYCKYPQHQELNFTTQNLKSRHSSFPLPIDILTPSATAFLVPGDLNPIPTGKKKPSTLQAP